MEHATDNKKWRYTMEVEPITNGFILSVTRWRITTPDDDDYDQPQPCCPSPQTKKIYYKDNPMKEPWFIEDKSDQDFSKL